MARANLVMLGECADIGQIDGADIPMSIDTTTAQSYLRQGNKTQGFETIIYVEKEVFAAIPGKKGSIVSIDGDECQVLKITDEKDGLLELQCGPFKPVRI